ncbi:tetratricopeptide repeat protein [Lentzea sp. NPDC005914]|uniref:tetratricopeptide repeat protein n=1 Tax=Lentzea sp. NPDC005914 TaxID=3154572 RepID=UPI003400C364
MPKYPVDTSGSNFSSLPEPTPGSLRQLDPDPVVHGRAAELAALRENLERDGVALLCGPPGTGKTTLALRLAHSVADRFRGGQLCADLSALSMDDVLASFIRALTHDRVQLWASRRAQLREVLGTRRVLFVLDNVSKGHDLALFRNVIATSRERLGGVVLGPMSPEDSLTLLRTHLGSRVDFEPEAARAFVKACHGLPLALVVAAGFARLRTTATLTALVEEIPAERGDVHDAFAWAYQQLSPDDRRVFRLLGDGFEREFSITALNALAGGDVRPSRNRLLALHLLENAPGDRITMHSLLREYAQSLTPREPEALGRLLDHYLSVADVETENAVAAVFVADDERRLALASALVDEMSVRVQEAAVEAARARENRAAEAVALAHLGHAWFDRGNLEEAERCHTEALEFHREPRALTGLANVYLESGGLEEAEALFKEVLAVRIASGDAAGEARALLSLGRTTGDIRYYEQARDICERIGDVVRLGRAYNGMGNVHQSAGSYEDAINCYALALQAFVDGLCLVNMGHAQLAAFGSSAAFTWYERAAEHAVRLRDKGLLADAARSLNAAGFVEEALRRMRQAEQLYLTAEDESP